MQRRSRWWVLPVRSVLILVALSGCDGDEDEVACFLVTELEPNDVFDTPEGYLTQAQEVGSCGLANVS